MKQNITQSTYVISNCCFIILMSLVCISNFSAYAQVKIISPNGGEAWQAGSTQSITWEPVKAIPGHHHDKK